MIPQPPPAIVAPATSSGLEPLIRRFQTDEQGLERFYDLPFSRSVRARKRKLWSETRMRIDALRWDSLDTSARVDALLLDNYLTHQEAQEKLAEKREAELAPLVPYAEKLIALEEARIRVEKPDPERWAAILTEIANDAKKAPRETSPVIALRASRSIDELNGILSRWRRHYEGFHPLVSWWCRKPAEDAQKALSEQSRYLRENVAKIKGEDSDPLIGDPIGREALMSDLAYERIPYTPEELVKIAEKEFAWCEVELKKATRDMGLGDDTKAALARVKTKAVSPGEQDQLVATQAREAIAFLKKNDLVTIEPLCEETWRVDMLDREGQKVLPFAAYGGQKMLVAYPLESMDDATKHMSLRANNEHFTHIVTPHELIPGHHLQGYMAERYRPYRRMFNTPFLVEGWSLYWEMQLWDKNWARGPEDRIGMLFWRMHRCARIIVSLGFHLGTMTPPQMIDFLVDRVGHERFSATSEVRRFVGDGYSPLYQCAYMIGGLQIRALQKELSKQSLKSFHDAVLHEGPIPIDLIRVALKGDKPARNQPYWKFDN
ncbi:MAG: DUF885 family protein [Armatimonas sp.]